MAQNLEIVWPRELATYSKVALAKQTDKILTGVGISDEGILQVAYWTEGTGAWHGPVPVGPPVLSPSSGVALAKQTKNTLTAVAISREGVLHVAWVDGTGQWNGPVPVGLPVLSPSSGVALAKQTDDILTAVAIGREVTPDRANGILHVASVKGIGQWNGPVPVGLPVLSPSSGIALAKQTDKVLTAAAVGSEGVLHIAWVEDKKKLPQWQGPVSVGSQVLSRSSGIALAKQTNEVLTAVAVGGNGVLHIAWVEDKKSPQWQGPVPIHGPTRRICQLTGNYDPEALPHINDSTRVHMGGTDLGFPVEHDKKLYFLFGDQFGDSYQENGDPIGWTCDQEVAPNGFRIDFVTEAKAPNYFRPLRVKGLDPLGAFDTPTGGFSYRTADSDKTVVQDRPRLWAFVNKSIVWNGDSQILLASTQNPEAADFALHYSVAYIDRDSKVEKPPPEVHKHDRLNLPSATVVNRADLLGLPAESEEVLLIWGQGYGPKWEAFLGYVELPLTAPLVSDRLGASQLPIRYYAGLDPNGMPQWTQRLTTKIDAVSTVIDPLSQPLKPVGLFDTPAVTFISMSRVPTLGYWLALYTEAWPYPHEDNGPGKAWQRPIVLRSSPTPWGPWSDPLPLLYAVEAYGRYLCNPEPAPQPARFDPKNARIKGWLYCPAIIDKFQCEANGITTLYYMLSTGMPYHVQLMRSDLRRLSS